MMTVETARRRSRIVAGIRSFFEDAGYLEVETPILAPSLIPERAIEVFATTYRNPFSQQRPMYLIPSPELWMKRLIADGWPSMYQLTKAFRNGESVGREHNPEFTMLEYYTVGADYEASFDVTQSLLNALAPLGNRRDLGPIARMTVSEAFQRYAQIDLDGGLSIESMREKLATRQIRFELEDDVETLFNRLFVHLVEPRLAELPAVALFDYPVDIPTTAQPKAGTPWSERWELYLSGIEVANCYTEETDPEAVDRYFATESRAKRESLEPHSPDEEYRRLFSRGFPPCSGAALGVDRLVQALLAEDSIEGMILFPLSSIFG